MNSIMTLSDLTALTGLDVFDYLDQEVSVPSSTVCRLRATSS